VTRIALLLVTASVVVAIGSGSIAGAAAVETGLMGKVLRGIAVATAGFYGIGLLEQAL